MRGESERERERKHEKERPKQDGKLGGERENGPFHGL